MVLTFSGVHVWKRLNGIVNKALNHFLSQLINYLLLHRELVA